MKQPTRTQTKGSATREEILAASERLLLERGFAGMSLDDILAATGLTKGAFFYHFKSKADLAHALVERYARNDFALFAGLSARADQLTQDPLESVVIFLKLFEEFAAENPERFMGCVFASYSYEEAQFEDAIHEIVRGGLGMWEDLYRRKFATLSAARPPRLPVTADELAAMIMAIIEGGFILSRVRKDGRNLVGPARQFRNYVELLFRP
jgi:TetR/AcrR family transcriptional repressor of nem operon